MNDTISEILDPRCVKLELDSRKKPDAIRELVDALAAGNAIGDSTALTEDLLEREKLSSTGIGNYIAIPHTLTDRVARTCIAFGRKRDGIKFDSVDRRPAKLFFLMVGPEGTHAEHLKLLSRLARYLHDGTFVQRLMDAESADDVLDAVRQREEAG